MKYEAQVIGRDKYDTALVDMYVGLSDERSDDLILHIRMDGGDTRLVLSPLIEKLEAEIAKFKRTRRT